MTHPVIGWESTEPIPTGHQFNDYLRTENGRLHLHNLDLTDLFQRENQPFPDADFWPSPVWLALP